MFEIQQNMAANMSAQLAEECAKLCNPGSEMHNMFDRISVGGELNEKDYEVMVATAIIAPAGGEVYYEDLEVVGWASISPWNHGEQTFLQAQAFVDRDYREKGYGIALLAVAAVGMPKTQMPVAVFSRECHRLALRLGWNTHRFERGSNGSWIRVEDLGGGGEHD